MQRLRVKFSRAKEIKFISHLDIVRLWERALRRAQIVIAYSEGFNPHPRISLAVPLALGVTSEAELMDIFLSRWSSPQWFQGVVSQQLPPGIEILGVFPVPPTAPSLQSQVRYAEYKVELDTEKELTEIEAAISGLLAAEHLPWHHERDTGTRNYDLRALIDDLWLMEYHHAGCTIGMRLRCDSGGSGRPEQVALALCFTSYPKSMHRTRLILEP
jgi:radical SAM-linked protein